MTSVEEKAISDNAFEYAKRQKKLIFQAIIGASLTAHQQPVAIFMAGSPGAGKTEFSRSLIGGFGLQGHPGIIRIDPDDIRPLLPGSDGQNGHLFVRATTQIENRLIDFAYKKGFDFLLDSAFSKEGHALQNVGRAINHGRKVHVFYMYQEPEIAWAVTQAREATEGRHITKQLFIERFLGAQKTIETVKKQFDGAVELTMVKHNAKIGDLTITEKIVTIDRLLKKSYTIRELEQMLH